MTFNCFMKTYLRFLFLIVFFISGRLLAQPYNSLPGAQHVIFLDFDGYTVTGTSWNSSYNGGNPIVCAASGYTDAQVSTVFNMVAEDYRPFNINITTDENVYNAASIQQRMRVLFTPTKNWYPQSAGGVAYLSTFGSVSNKVCFIFTSALGNASNAGEAGSHEAGHTLTLQHHSEFNALCEKTNEYNSGTGSGETGWAPIMGVGYTKNMTLWSDVASNFSCTYMQDDLAGITSAPNNGVAYRADDHGNDISSATPLVLMGNAFSDSGIIGTNTDVDVFHITLATKSYINIQVNPWNWGSPNTKANLDVSLVVKNSTGQIMRTHEPLNVLNAWVNNLLLEPGDYYFQIKGTANANQSGYGSLGKYYITGLVTAALPMPLAASLVASDTVICKGASIDFFDQSEGSPSSWTWAFTGGTPATSNVQNPVNIMYANAGTYAVKLTVFDGLTNSSRTYNNYIRVNNLPTLNIVPSNPYICGNNTTTLMATGALSYQWSPAGGLINTNLPRTTVNGISENTTYTVLGTDVNGCTGSKEVTVQYFPPLQLIKSPATERVIVCRYDSTELSVSGAENYTWSPGTGLSNTNTGNVKVRLDEGSRFYTVTGTDANGCSASVYFSVLARACDSLAANVFVDSSAICTPTCVMFTDSSTGHPTSWQWSFPGGTPATSSLQNPGLVCYTAPGSYDVSLTVSDGVDFSTRVFPGLIVAADMPVVTMTAPVIPLCKGDTSGIKLNGAQYYMWSFDPSLIFPAFPDSIRIIPQDTTTYYVKGFINVFNNNGYNNSGNSFVQCSDTESIRINVVNCSTVPLKILYFTAVQNGEAVLTQWKFAEQESVNYIVLERSLDGIHFETLQQVMKSQNDSYHWVDKKMIAGTPIYYYRLRCQLEGGRMIYSDIEKVRIQNKNNPWVSIRPNPVINIMELGFIADKNGQASLSIHDMPGKLMYKETFETIKGYQDKKMNLSSLLPGVYLLHLQVGEKQITQKIIRL